MNLWRRNNTLLRDDSNRIILCDECPCDIGPNPCALSWDGSRGALFSATVTAPDCPVDAMMLACVLTAAGDGTGSLTPPVGWTTLHTGLYFASSPSAKRRYWFGYRQRQSGDGSNWTWTVTAPDSINRIQIGVSPFINLPITESHVEVQDTFTHVSPQVVVSGITHNPVPGEIVNLVILETSGAAPTKPTAFDFFPPGNLLTTAMISQCKSSAGSYTAETWSGTVAAVASCTLYIPYDV